MTDRKRACRLIEAAQAYHDNHHWVPLRLRGKSPEVMGEGWTKRTLADGIPTFQEDENIGVLLGKPSGDLVRLDPDYPSVPEVTSILWSKPSACFGRASAPGSGRLYICKVKSTNFLLPITMKNDPRLPLHDGKPNLVVFQILSTGKQSMVPPSIHPETGEDVLWEMTEPPGVIEPAALLRRVGLEAFLMVCVYFWPPRGTRNEAAMALTRVLLETLQAHGLADETKLISIVDRLVTAVAMAGGDGEASRNGKQRSEATLERLKRSEDATGLPRLVELMALPAAVAGTFRKWLGTRDNEEILPRGVDPDVDKLNREYALVIVGDKTVIMRTTTEGIKFLTVSTFYNWFDNKRITHNAKPVSLAKYWMVHPQRREYDGLTFAPGREVPGQYNLWRGFAVQPKAGDCSKFLAHILDNVCCGDESLYRWVMGWFAQIMQHPDQKMGTSLTVRGKQGTGKTFVGKVIGSLLGEHYSLVADPRYVTGRFNSHMVQCLLLHCDESFWAGDHAAEGKLKDLITGEDHYVEFKGKEPIRVRNYVRLLVTGNPDWVVPAGFEERRFCVLEIGEAQMQNTAYFKAIADELDNGGREALLDHLLKFDLSTVDLREIPRTSALLDQKLASLTTEKGWWLDVLNKGELPYGGGIHDDASCRVQHLFNDYVAHTGKTGRRRSIETALGMFLNKHVPGLKRGNDHQGSYYVFPTLAECRAAFEKKLQQTFNWTGPANWWKRERNDPPF
jgi:hypothetical protein